MKTEYSNRRYTLILNLTGDKPPGMCGDALVTLIEVRCFPLNVGSIISWAEVLNYKQKTRTR